MFQNPASTLHAKLQAMIGRPTKGRTDD